MRINTIKKQLFHGNKRASLLLMLVMLWLCGMPHNVLAADSLNRTTPVEIPVNTDSLATDTKDDVYKNPDYFRDVPVEQLDNLADTANAGLSFRQMDKKYQSAEFDYNEDHIDRLSWWNRLERWLNDFFRRILPHFDINLSKTVYYFAIGVGVLALAYILYRLLAKGKRPLFKEENEPSERPADWVEKKLMEVNLNTYLENALADENYVLAIRYLHLINLKALAEKHLIDWNYQKTNHDFLYELKEDKLKKAFAQTIRIFEYIWYGGFDISENRFRQYHQLFEQFHQDISRQIAVRKEEHSI